MKFHVYRVAASGWEWLVTNEVGPAFIVVCRSGRQFASEQAATDDYKAFVKWACSQPPTSAEYA